MYCVDILTPDLGFPWMACQSAVSSEAFVGEVSVYPKIGFALT